MFPWKSTSIEREPDRDHHGQQWDHRQSIDYSPSSEELDRVVEVAETLGLSPETVRGVFQRENDGVPTDERLRDAVELVEKRIADSRREGPRH